MNKTSYMRYLKENILGILGLFVGIIGIFLAIFFKQQAVEKREPFFFQSYYSTIYRPSSIEKPPYTIARRPAAQLGPYPRRPQ